jgi:hypothetical protein
VHHIPCRSAHGPAEAPGRGGGPAQAHPAQSLRPLQDARKCRPRLPDLQQQAGCRAGRGPPGCAGAVRLLRGQHQSRPGDCGEAHRPDGRVLPPRRNRDPGDIRGERAAGRGGHLVPGLEEGAGPDRSHRRHWRRPAGLHIRADRLPGEKALGHAPRHRRRLRLAGGCRHIPPHLGHSGPP